VFVANSESGAIILIRKLYQSARRPANGKLTYYVPEQFAKFAKSLSLALVRL